MTACDDLARFRLRWAVDISGWTPQASEWKLLIRLLPDEDIACVQRFKFQADQKRALLSR